MVAIFGVGYVYTRAKYFQVGDLDALLICSYYVRNVQELNSELYTKLLNIKLSYVCMQFVPRRKHKFL
jgi:hypothetical protein